MIFYQNTICTGNACKSAPSTSAAPVKGEPPKLSLGHITDDPQPRGNKLKINAGGTDEMRMRHGVKKGGGGGAAALSGQRVEGANTQAQGKLSPSCPPPPTPPSQFIYRAQMGWDQ